MHCFLVSFESILFASYIMNQIIDVDILNNVLRNTFPINNYRYLLTFNMNLTNYGELCEIEWNNHIAKFSS